MEVEAGSTNNFRSTKQEDKHLTNSHAISATGGRSRRCLCLLITIGVIVVLGVLFLILGLTVFKVKRPTTTVDSVSVADLDVSLNLAGGFNVRLNVTLDVGISVRNPNRVGFKYSDSTAYLKYRGNDVGEVPVPDGRIGARETRHLNLTLTLMADRLLSNSDLFSDIRSGTLPFQTYIRISGHARIVFKIHVVTYSTCDLQVRIASRSISDQKCHYKTKL